MCRNESVMGCATFHNYVLHAFSAESLRQRKTGSEDSSASDSKSLSFSVVPESRIKTDMSSGGGFQKCVRFTSNQNVMVTGGADGYIRVWQVSFGVGGGGGGAWGVPGEFWTGWWGGRCCYPSSTYYWLCILCKSRFSCSLGSLTRLSTLL